jgi:hypothetical protein
VISEAQRRNAIAQTAAAQQNAAAEPAALLVMIGWVFCDPDFNPGYWLNRPLR